MINVSKVRLGALAALFAIFCCVVGAGTALAVQGHMLNARSYLNSALTELEMATADKAGHRVNAINLVKNAISQVNQGIAAGAK